MGYKDNFEKACALDSLSWVSMEPKARTARLASRFLKEEPKLRRLREKGEWYVTAGVVKPWLLSLYEPPRGGFSTLIKSVMEEIERQRIIVATRAKNRPWKWEVFSRRERRNRVSAGMYGVLARDYDDKVKRTDNACTTITTISGVLMALDVQSDANARIYMRHRETGRVKVVILDFRPGYNGPREWPLTKVLLHMAPVAVERAIFGGARLAVDFAREGYTLDGAYHAWRHIVKVVEGPKRALRTRQKGSPKDPDDDE
jgi:hypothetical protein